MQIINLNHLFKTKELNLYVLGNHLIRMLTQLKNLNLIQEGRILKRSTLPTKQKQHNTQREMI